MAPPAPAKAGGAQAGEWRAPEKGCNQPGLHSCRNLVNLVRVLVFIPTILTLLSPQCFILQGEGFGHRMVRAHLQLSKTTG